MKITCQSCHSKYNVADEKVLGKIVKIRCRKCGGTIVVNGTTGTPSVSSAPSNGARTAEEPAAHARPTQGAAPGTAAGAVWHVNLGDGDQRTVSLQELVAGFTSGSVTQDALVWTDGMEEWKPLAEAEAVVAALQGQRAAGAHQADAPNDPPEPQTAYYDRAPAPAYEAPREEPTRAIAAAPEPRRAAVGKRETRGRDLFATYAGEELQASAQAANNMLSPAVDDGRLTGQRNENSVLFSLGSLTKNADERAPAHAASVKDDSGIIDLKALAARAEAMRPAVRNDIDAFAPPLGFASPAIGSPLGPLGGMGAESGRKSKVPALVGAIAGVAVLLVLGIVIGVKIAGSGSVPAPTASATATVAPPPVVSATAEPAAAASAAASASAAAAAAKPKVVHPGGGGGGMARPSPASGPPAAANGAALPPSPTPKKTGGDCGCNGDLMCLMKCSTH